MNTLDLDARIAADEHWLDQLVTWRAALCDEQLTIKSPIRDAHQQGREINLSLSIRCIDRGLHVINDSGYDLTTLRLGALMIASGYEVVGADPSRSYAGQLPWYGSIPEVETRLAALTTRRDHEQRAREDALLTDDERQQRDAEAKGLRDALNGLYIKLNVDGRPVAYRSRQAYINDEPLKPEDMSAVERAAFAQLHTEPLHTEEPVTTTI